jgi:hypothetical protein
MAISAGTEILKGAPLDAIGSGALAIAFALLASGRGERSAAARWAVYILFALALGLLIFRLLGRATAGAAA